MVLWVNYHVLLPHYLPVASHQTGLIEVLAKNDNGHFSHLVLLWIPFSHYLTKQHLLLHCSDRVWIPYSLWWASCFLPSWLSFYSLACKAYVLNLSIFINRIYFVLILFALPIIANTYMVYQPLHWNKYCKLPFITGCLLLLGWVLLFKDFIYLFLERVEGMERGRETSIYGCHLLTPYWGPGLQPRHVP